jgi:hypothetical protein
VHPVRIVADHAGYGELSGECARSSLITPLFSLPLRQRVLLSHWNFLGILDDRFARAMIHLLLNKYSEAACYSDNKQKHKPFSARAKSFYFLALCKSIPCVYKLDSRIHWAEKTPEDRGQSKIYTAFRKHPNRASNSRPYPGPLSQQFPCPSMLLKPTNRNCITHDLLCTSEYGSQGTVSSLSPLSSCFKSIQGVAGWKSSSRAVQLPGASPLFLLAKPVRNGGLQKFMQYLLDIKSWKLRHHSSWFYQIF